MPEPLLALTVRLRKLIVEEETVSSWQTDLTLITDIISAVALEKIMK
jgi:hypothetical protein